MKGVGVISWSVVAALNLAKSTTALELSYQNTVTVLPDDKLVVKWGVKNEQELCLHLSASESDVLDGDGRGWIGFGIAERTSGSMAGSDIVVVKFNERQPSVHDMYAVGYEKPIEDCDHAWELRSSQISNQLVEAEICRQLASQDPQDHDLSDRTELDRDRVIAAMGKGDFAYHGQAREAFEVPLLGDHARASPVEVLRSHSDVLTVDFVHGLVQTGDADGEGDVCSTNENGTIIQGKKTQYCWYSWKAETYINFEDGYDYFFVGFEPILQKSTEQYVHHFLFNMGFETLYPWAAGGEAYALPEGVGFPVMPSSEININTHFDNPSLVQIPIRDNSGVRVFILRKPSSDNSIQRAGVLQLGDGLVRLSRSSETKWLPEGVSQLEVDCPGNCFQQDMHVFNVLHHLHETGIQLTNVHLDSEGNDVTDPIMSGALFYDWAFQPNLPVNFTIRPGDSITTKCVYRTEGATKFGLGSEDEMCIVFVSYWPRIDSFPYCGLVIPGYGCLGSHEMTALESFSPGWPEEKTCDDVLSSAPSARISSMALSLMLTILILVL